MANTKITSRVLADNAVLTANITDANVTTAKVADNAVTGDKVADDVALAGNPTTTTQSAGNNTTRIATTAFVSTAVANLADSAPDALNTLNELAAAMGDDANFSTTITNSIAAKLPLAGGTMTGTIAGFTSTGIDDNADATAITINSSEQVGIGVTPVVTLDVGGTSDLVASFRSSTNNGNTSEAKIRAVDSDSSHVAIFQYQGYQHRFQDASANELVRIDNSGNVGIGTTSPQAVLHLKGAGNELRFERTNFDPLQVGIGTANGQNGLHLTNITDSTVPFSLHENSPTNTLVIDSSGNVGIGTASPTGNGNLNVQAHSSSTVTSLKLSTSTSGSGANDGFDLISNANIAYIWNRENERMIFGTNNTEVMRITATGNVGIGTTSPSRVLHTQGSSVLFGNTSGAHEILFGDSAHRYFKLYTPSSPDYASIRTGTTDILVAHSGGNVGIGTTSPQSALHTHIASSGGVYHQFTNTSVGSGASDGWKIGIHDDENFIIWGQETSESFRVYNNGAYRFTIDNNGAVSVAGSFSKGSGSFKIDHPLPAKKDTHHLVHSFVEAPQADLIYRGTATLSSGSATVNLDTVAGMTEGTYVLLNTNSSCFTSNETDWDAVKGSVSGNTLTITCQNDSSTATVSWLVVGERHDQHMKDTEWTDDDGKVIVEPLKEEE